MGPVERKLRARMAEEGGITRSEAVRTLDVVGGVKWDWLVKIRAAVLVQGGRAVLVVREPGRSEADNLKASIERASAIRSRGAAERAEEARRAERAIAEREQLSRELASARDPAERARIIRNSQTSAFAARAITALPQQPKDLADLTPLQLGALFGIEIDTETGAA